MRSLVRILIPVIAAMVVECILLSINEKNNKAIIDNLTKDSVIIQLPTAYLWVGCLDVLVSTTFILLLLYSSSGKDNLWVLLLFVTLIALGTVLILSVHIWRIKIFREEDYFILRTVFLKTYRIPYSDCLSYKLTANALTVKTTAQIFKIDTHATNFEFLLTMLIKHGVTNES